jgi:hypothetical protein
MAWELQSSLWIIKNKKSTIKKIITKKIETVEKTKKIEKAETVEK